MKSPSDSERGRYVEVCAGAGGWGIGLHRAGWRGTGIEWDADASETHRRHVGPCITADITAAPSPHTADLVCGGVPCQSFSTAGARGGLDDPRGQLFRALLRHAAEAGARCVALENVRGLISCGALPVILAAFRAAGYEPAHALLNACDYGVPQNRVRLFIVGFRDAADLARFRWPAPTHGAPGNLWGLKPWRTVRDALGLGDGSYRVGRIEGATGWNGQRMIDADAAAPTVTGRSNPELLSRLDRDLDAPAPTIMVGGGDGRSVIADQRVRERFDVALATNVLDRPSLTVGIGHGSPYAKSDTREAVRAALSRLDRPAPTMKHNSGREGVGPKRASGLLSVDIASATGDATRSGRLTVRDCARLQSFPDEVEFTGTLGAQFRQIGNAICPPMGEAIARSIAVALYGRSLPEVGE